MKGPRGSWPTVMRETAGAYVEIAGVEADTLAESVTIVNRGEIDQPLTEWALASLHRLEVFQFPGGTVVPPGGQVRVLSGEYAAATAPRDLVWTRQPVWSNRSDTVLLFDNLGHEVDRLAYPRPTVREPRVPKRKMLIRDRDGYHLVDWDDAVPPPRIRDCGL